MAGATVADFIGAMPGEDLAEINPAVERLFALEDEINDEFLGLAPVRFVPSGGGQLIVTDTRLILMGDGGRLTIIEYAEVSALVVGPGAKKVFGGYDQSYFMVHLHRGGMFNLIFAGEHNWALATMAIAQRAYEQYRLQGRPLQASSAVAGTAATGHDDSLGGGDSVTLSPDQVRELDLLLTTLSVYAEARSNDDMVRRVEAFTAKHLRRGRNA